MFPFSGGIDTDERKRVLRRLCDALYEYLALPIVEMERAVVAEKERQEQMGQYSPTFPPPVGLHIPSKLDQLAAAQENADALRAQIEQLNTSAETAPEFMVAYIKGALITPLETQLKDQERWISELQRALEREQETHPS